MGRLFGTGNRANLLRTNLGLYFVIKKKRAAQGRRSGTHCGRHTILKYFRERRSCYREIELWRREALVSLFVRLQEWCSLGRQLSRGLKNISFYSLFNTPRRPVIEWTRMRKNSGVISSSRIWIRRCANAFSHQ